MKLTMTSRCESGQRRDQAAFVAARRRWGRPERRNTGTSLPRGGATRQSATVREACRVVNACPARGPIGSRARRMRAKAMEGVKSLEAQPRRTRRRRGRGTAGEPSWEPERPVSAPTVRSRRRHRGGGSGAACPISSAPAKGVGAERGSEWPVVPEKSEEQKPMEGRGHTWSM